MSYWREVVRDLSPLRNLWVYLAAIILFTTFMETCV